MPKGQYIPAPPIGEEVANLPVQIAFVVPSTRGGSGITNEKFRERIEFTREWMDRRFGGDTTLRGSGGYIGEAGELVEEEVAIVEASMSVDSYEEHKDDFAEFIRRRQKNWEQDTVLYRVEERVFIYPKREYLDDGDTVPPGLIRVG